MNLFHGGKVVKKAVFPGRQRSRRTTKISRTALRCRLERLVREVF